MHRQGIDERLPREIIPKPHELAGHGAGFSGAGTAEVTPLEIPRCSALLFSRKSKRRKQWPGRRPLWLKSASVSKSMAICQPMDMCRLSSSSLHYCLADALTRRGLRFFVSGGRLGPKRKRRKYVIISGDGDPSPRCREPMQIRAFDGSEEKPSHSFFTRWFCCMNETCKTTLVMPARYKV